MKAEAIYKDIDGNDCNIWQMLKREPDWAASRILLGELAINRLKELGEWPLKKKIDPEYCKIANQRINNAQLSLF